MTEEIKENAPISEDGHTIEEREGEASFAEAKAEAEQAADDKAEAFSREGKPTMPKPTFATFVLSLASSALVQLGEVPDPGTGKMSEDIALAKHSIDILAMLQEKIRDGLDEEESRLLEGLLYELRMKYVVKK